jgi:hypothetical protein
MAAGVFPRFCATSRGVFTKKIAAAHYGGRAFFPGRKECMRVRVWDWYFFFLFFCGKTVWDFAGWQEDMDSWTVASDNKAKAQVSICC